MKKYRILSGLLAVLFAVTVLPAAAPARALGIRTCFLNTDGVTPPPCDLYCDGADYARLLREVLA